ncbi:hypothetical protein [Nitratireductor sp. StC3]|uniref:hypothetical protein n=1 Tax=Nitratireductor sp. StC3 TaxID=2126741 RepID=UPI000D0D1C93|nr:hypothetical protein [Nitratireductor sp. StC3]PSM18224.1 hypothetical protein C7T96_10155 [Nitratireductor sp. StC3]
MVDLSLTPADVVAGSGAVIEHGRAGATIAAGQVVYKEAASGKFKLADSNSGTAEVKVAAGIALNGAGDGQPLAIVKAGDVTLGSVLTAGGAYYLSETPGGIQPAADLASEDVILLGLARSATVLALRIQIPGVTLGA